MIHNQFILKFQKGEVEDHVVAPLNKLLLMFQGPTKVIKKRHDKLLDYDSITRKEKSTRDESQLRLVGDFENVKSDFIQYFMCPSSVKIYPIMSMISLIILTVGSLYSTVKDKIDVDL